MKGIPMDSNAKKTALRMISYGLYVMTSESEEGDIAAATVSWVTQTSFEPPLIAIGVKVDSGIHTITKSAGTFALNIINKDQPDIAYAFFKPSKKQDGKLNGESYTSGVTGSPILDNVPAYIECKLVKTIDVGDHSIFVGEVINVDIKTTPEGRPDSNTLTLKDLGDKIFYGG
jgi:flavin reductase (DIM6/NTAB) family NADH-FMN oxidoreductase RutF